MNRLNAKQKKEQTQDSLKMFKKLLKTKTKVLGSKDVIPGNMITFSYNAKNKDNPFDKTPLAIVLRVSNNYMLGVNFHWIPIPQRRTLLSFITKKNKKNIENNKPLDITYKELKPIINKLGLNAVIRLYIRKRISKKGLVIPHKHFTRAINLPSENFIGISAEQAYKLAMKKTKSYRKRRKHGSSAKK